MKEEVHFWSLNHYQSLVFDHRMPKPGIFGCQTLKTFHFWPSDGFARWFYWRGCHVVTGPTWQAHLYPLSFSALILSLSHPLSLSLSLLGLPAAIYLLGVLLQRGHYLATTSAIISWVLLGAPLASHGDSASLPSSTATETSVIQKVVLLGEVVEPVVAAAAASQRAGGELRY